MREVYVVYALAAVSNYQPMRQLYQSKVRLHGSEVYGAGAR